MDAQLHLRQSQRQPLVADRDAVAAGERQLQPAAEREAVDRRNRSGSSARSRRSKTLWPRADERVAAASSVRAS